MTDLIERLQTYAGCLAVDQRQSSSSICALVREAADALEAKTAAISTHEKFAWLCYQDYGFWGNGGNDTPQMCLLLNDVFVAGADAMSLSPEQIDEVYAIAKLSTPEDVWEWAKNALADTENK
jgi:hypothetical protein